MSTLTKPWAQRIGARIMRGESLTHGEIRSMQKILRTAINSADYLNGSNATPSATGDDAARLIELCEEFRPWVTSVQSQHGIIWLRNAAKTPNGTRRNTAKGREFTDADVRVIESESVQFRLHGWFTFEEGRYLRYIAPVYTCIGDNGASFDYYRVPWQSGDCFEILRHADARP